MRHYKLRLVFFTPFFTAVYIIEWLILQTIYVVNKEILQKKSVGYNGAYTVDLVFVTTSEMETWTRDPIWLHW